MNNTKVLDDYEKYQEIKDLIEADKEFERDEGIHFSSLKDLENFLDNDFTYK